MMSSTDKEDCLITLKILTTILYIINVSLLVVILGIYQKINDYEISIRGIIESTYFFSQLNENEINKLKDKLNEIPKKDIEVEKSKYNKYKNKMMKLHEKRSNK